MQGEPRGRRDEVVADLRSWVERARHFSGWKFDDVAPRVIEPGLPWDYARTATERVAAAKSMLDMGTGGGELFADLCQGYRGRAVATEEWKVNAPIAKGSLSPLGAEVVRAKSLSLPFRDAVFDLALNRHEELDPAETTRVLRPGGMIFTQQVGRNDWRELRPFLPRMREFGPLFEQYVSGFRKAGMTIVRAEARDVRVAYRGLGEVVFMVCLSPWLIPDFDPLGRDLNAVLEVGEHLATRDGLMLTESRFLIQARKPSQ